MRAGTGRGRPALAALLAALLGALLGALLVAGWSGGADQSSGGADLDTASGGGAGDEAAARESGPAPDGRAVVRTARVSLVGDDLAGIRAGTERLLDGLGGRVATEDTYRDHKGRVTSSELDLRVPADRLDALLEGLAELGRVQSTSRRDKDVTAQVVDVDARVRTHQASLRRLRAFLDDAADVDTMVRLESEITEREAALESLTGRRDALADQVEMARVAVSLYRPEVAEASFAEEGFAAGVRRGWEALRDVVVVAATAAGAALPFLVAAGLLLTPVVLATRAIRRRRPAPVAGEEP